MEPQTGNGNIEIYDLKISPVLMCAKNTAAGGVTRSVASIDDSMEYFGAQLLKNGGDVQSALRDTLRERTGNFGVKVEMAFSKTGHFKGAKQTLRNVTEIHYCYPAIFERAAKRIAFESDIHETGISYDIKDVSEFETSLESCKAEEF